MSKEFREVKSVLKLMKLDSIKTEQEYDKMLAWVDEQFDKKIPPASLEGEVLQKALLLVKAYENEHYPIPTVL